MSLRETPIEREIELPDGRTATIRVGLFPDPYIERRENDTVSVELLVDGEHAAFVNTVLDPGQEGEARSLVRELADGLQSGALAPTASAIEPLALR